MTGPESRKDIYGVYLLRADYRDYRFKTFSGRLPWVAYSADKKFIRQAVAVGFGVSTPEEAADISEFADGSLSAAR